MIKVNWLKIGPNQRITYFTAYLKKYSEHPANRLFRIKSVSSWFFEYIQKYLEKLSLDYKSKNFS